MAGVVLTVIAILAVVACLLSRASSKCNLHLLSGGSAYRSGQMTAPQLREFAAQTGLKSIINLRGDQKGAPWYDAEARLCDELDIARYDICLSADYPPDRLTFARLVSAMDRCQRPVLIHCWAGSDRTGFACVAWRLLADDVALDDSMNELSIYYGHVPYTFADQRLHQFFNDYRRWLIDNGRHHHAKHFREWSLKVDESARLEAKGAAN